MRPAVLRALPRMFAVVLACVCATVTAQPRAPVESAAAAPASATASASQRPRIGLVLSGGGARGMAHVGVLRELERLRVPVDIVVGTSFGAIVGGAYAGGADVGELDALIQRVPWESVLQDRPPRDELTYRRREDDRLVSSRFEMAAGRDGLTLPLGAFTSLEVERLLRQVAPAGVLHKVEELPLTYRAVATDMLTGELVVPVGVSLFTAMRASMAVPSAFAPITVDGRVLGDGGLVSNLPVRVARDLGAEVIIAVNLGTPLGGPEMLTSALGMAQQMLNILTEQNVERSLRELTPQDILITPDLRGVQFMQFDQIGRTIEAGAAAARAVETRLARWSVGAAEYAAFSDTRRRLHRALAEAPPVVAAVGVEGRGAIADLEAAQVVADAGLRPGEPISAETVNAAAGRLQQQTGAERVDALVTGDGASRDIVLLPIASPLGLSRFRLGMELESDGNTLNGFTLSGLYTMGRMNAWGAEWRTLLRAGALRELQTEWYQPLGAGSPWFASVRADARSFDATIYTDFVAAYDIGIQSTSASAAIGRRVFESGQARLGVQRRYLRLRSVVPDGNDMSKDGVTSVFADLNVDTLDSLGFPTRGYLLAASYENFGTDRDLQRSSYVMRYDGLVGFSRGSWAGHVYAAGLRGSLARALPLSLGGFLRLSGAPTGSVVGEQLAFGRVVAAREVGRVPAAIGGAIRLGMSLETGREFGPYISTTGGTFFAGSAFAAIETRFGPLYLAVGHTHNVGTAVYLYLGSVLLPNGLVR